MEPGGFMHDERVRDDFQSPKTSRTPSSSPTTRVTAPRASPHAFLGATKTSWRSQLFLLAHAYGNYHLYRQCALPTLEAMLGDLRNTCWGVNDLQEFWSCSKIAGVQMCALPT